MRLTQSVAFGLVSLVCTINASITMTKPILPKRQGPEVTVSQDGCTAVCIDSPIEGLGYSCGVYCDQASSTKMPATSTHKSTLRSTVTSTVTSKPKATLAQRSSVSANTGACHETCSVNEAEGDFDCSFSCDLDFSTAMPVALHQRTVVSAVRDDCTAVCWDLMPGTECDVQCSSDFKTAMPVGFAAPSKAARENVPAHRVHEARLARKFGGVVARDGNVRTLTSTLWGPTLTSTITLPTIMPLQVPQTAEAPAPPAILSQASAAISAAQQVLPTFASVLSVDSKVDSLLSAMFTTSHTSATADPVPTSSALKVSITTTAISIALETTTASATSSKTTTALATVSETTTALVISSKTTTAAATSPKTTTAIAIVSETTTELVTSSTTVAATSPKTTATTATESETTTALITSSKTTTKSATASKTTTKSATTSKTTTKSTTASETVTSSTTSSGTTTGTTTWYRGQAVTETTISVYDITGAASVPTGLVLPIFVGLAANAVFLI